MRGDVRWARTLLRLQKALYAASSLHEIRDCTVRVLHDIANPTSATFRVQSAGDGSATFPSALGPNAESLLAMWQPPEAVTEEELATFARGEPSWCESLSESECPEFRRRVGLGMLSYLAVPVHFSPDQPWAAVGYVNKTETAFEEREQIQAALIASAVRWALRAGRFLFYKDVERQACGRRALALSSDALPE